MKIHEYQAKAILARYGVPVPKGEMANTLEEANDVTRKLFAEGAPNLMQRLSRLPAVPHVDPLLRGKPIPFPLCHKHHL